MLKIGLTGGIGTGKSSVTEAFQSLGATVINADLLGHEAYLPGTVGFDEVVAEFGLKTWPRCEIVRRDRPRSARSEERVASMAWRARRRSQTPSTRRQPDSLVSINAGGRPRRPLRRRLPRLPEGGAE